MSPNSAVEHVVTNRKLDTLTVSPSYSFRGVEKVYITPCCVYVSILTFEPADFFKKSGMSVTLLEATSTSLFFNFLQSIISWWMHRLVRWD
jgi:hypothetical protein